MLGDSHRNLLASGTSSHKKHLDKFFKIFHTSFWRLVRDSFQSWKTCVLHNEGYFQVSFQKLFNFPSHFVTVHCLVHSSPSQTHRVYSKILHFLQHLFTNIQEQGMGFLIFSKIFMFQDFNFLDCVFCWILKNMLFEYGLGIFYWVCWLGFVGFQHIMPSIHDFMYASHFLVVYLVCVALCISCS